MPIMGSARSLGWTLVISFATAVVITIAGLWYTNYVDDQAKARTDAAILESNRKWCDVVILFDDTYRTTPPSTPAGQRLAKFFAERRKDFSCERHK